MNSNKKDGVLKLFHMPQLTARVVATAMVMLFAVVLNSGWQPLHAAPPAKLALTGARIITVSGDDIDQGTILIEYGKITAIGKDIEIPYDAVEVDCSGKVLFPGMIDPHNWRGLDRPNENLPVTPYLDVYDALDPSRLFFEDCLRKGITTVHISQANNTVIGAVTRAVRPIGMTPDEMTVKASVGLKISITPKRGSDRMLQLQTLRDTYDELQHYLGVVAERRYEEELKKDDKILDVSPKEARIRGKALIRERDYDDRHRSLVKLTEGKLAAWLYVGAATDVHSAVAISKQFGLENTSVFLLGGETVRAVKELKAAGRPVVLPADLVYRDRDPISGEIVETFIPKTIYDSGLQFALRPNGDASLAERFLTYQAARCVRNGVPRRVALKAITLNPAKMLGLGDQLGSLEVGKVANIVVFTADPLDFSAWIEQVYIDGILAYERQRDPRIQDLLPKAKIDKPTEIDLKAENSESEEKAESEPAKIEKSKSKNSKSDSDESKEG